jgi:hypothetical protein
MHVTLYGDHKSDTTNTGRKDLLPSFAPEEFECPALALI